MNLLVEFPILLIVTILLTLSINIIVGLSVVGILAKGFLFSQPRKNQKAESERLLSIARRAQELSALQSTQSDSLEPTASMPSNSIQSGAGLVDSYHKSKKQR